jgi:hypothetical protein
MNALMKERIEDHGSEVDKKRRIDAFMNSYSKISKNAKNVHS